MSNFSHVHESLALLDVREVDFLAGIIACRIERLSEFEDDSDGEDDREPELKLAA